jgi:drug/metabolite transporter (DMT)-like permease
MPTRAENARGWQIAVAFLAVYLVWGSTYLAIRVAIEALPPFLMAATRFLTAGVLLYAVGRLGGAPRPALHEWRASVVLGALFLLVGNGGVVWAEAHGVPSGLAALLVATTPLWTVLFEWRAGGAPPDPGTAVGLLAGLGGVALLVVPGSSINPGLLDIRGAAGCLIASLSWSFASVHSLKPGLPRSPAIASSLQMLAGGALLATVGLVLGEGGRAVLGAMSLRSLLALAYLIVFGSLVTFTAFTWLLRVSTPSRVATCAYINPVVAVLLGWGFAGERLTARSLVAAAVILGAVVLITTARARRPVEGRRAGEPEPEPEAI